MNQRKTKEMVAVSLMAAIFSIFAPIALPLPFTPVPITLGIFLAVFAGIFLGKIKGTVCVFVYLLLGAVGIPVFSGYMGGISVLLGPTGGFLLGYLMITFAAGVSGEVFFGKALRCFFGSLFGVGCCYGMGILWLCIQTGVSLEEGFLMGVLPFLPVDIVKIILAVCLGETIKKRLLRENLIHAKKGRN